MLRAVLFDLDDTLLPEASAVREALTATCQPVEERLALAPGGLVGMVEAVAHASWESLDRMGIEARFGVTWEECLWGHFGPATRLQIPGLAGLAAMLRSRVFADALAACGVQLPIAAELEARFEAERRRRFVPFAEASSLIDSLKDRALLIGCATNGASELQREKIVTSGAAGWFDAVTISGEEGIGKPDPTILLRLCERLEVAPADSIYVGNSLRRDVASAAAAGIRSVFVERFEPEVATDRGGVAEAVPTPDRVVYETHGILGLVDGMRAGRAFRVFDGEGVALAVDEPVRDGRGFVTRVGAERDELRPAVRGATVEAVLQAGFRNLRARSGAGSYRHELGEPIDWDALLR